MIRRIKIEGYKSLAALEVNLEPLSLLFGPNAAGKSNFLDALQLLSRTASSRTLKEAFAPPYRGTPLESFAFGVDGIKGLLAKESVAFSMEVDVWLSQAVIERVNQQIAELKKSKPSDGGALPADRKPSFVRERYLRYRLGVEILPKSGILRVRDEYLAALNAAGEVTGKRKPFLELMGDRFHLRMEGQAHPTYYERYLDHTILSMPLYPPHHPHVAALRQELASWFFFYFEPRERMRAPNPVKEVRHIGLMGEELASFLNTLRVLDEPQFNAVEKSLHLIIPSITGIQVGVDNLGRVELQILEGGTPIPASVVSEGTLRVLGLLALGGVKEPPALLGFEEPENGIHPRRLRMLAELLKNRVTGGDTQLIVTTHSPLLPDLLPADSLFVCRKEEGHTAVKPLPDAKPIYRQISVKKALDDEDEGPTVSERLLRGDFDA